MSSPRVPSHRPWWGRILSWLPLVLVVCLLGVSAFVALAASPDQAGLLADTTAPVVTFTFPAPNGNNGWFVTSPVVGSITANDTASGGSTITAINCVNATVGPITGLGTTAATASLTATGDGVRWVSCTASDNSGNSGSGPGSTGPLSVKIDATKPVISAWSQPPAGAGVWYNRDVGVFFHCDESLSGIAVDTASSTRVISAEGTQSATNPGVCTDNAGNAANPVTITNINIDKTSPYEVWELRPPLVSGKSVSFRFKGVDPVSGGVASGVDHFECMLDRGAFTPCTTPWTLTNLTAGWHHFQVRVVDKAGNPDFSPGGYSWSVQASTPVTPQPTPTPVSACTTPVVKVDVGSSMPPSSVWHPELDTIWLSDQPYVPGVTTWGYVGGQSYATTAAISGSPEADLYKTERWWAPGGDAGYRFELANGRYHMVLRFAEIYPWVWAKTRVFTVLAEGQPVAANVDVYAAAGGLYKAYDLSGLARDVTVSDGLLEIDLEAIAGNPALNALEIYRCP